VMSRRFCSVVHSANFFGPSSSRSWRVPLVGTTWPSHFGSGAGVSGGPSRHRRAGVLRRRADAGAAVARRKSVDGGHQQAAVDSYPQGPGTSPGYGKKAIHEARAGGVRDAPG